MGRRGAYAAGTDWHAEPLDTVYRAVIMQGKAADLETVEYG